MKVYNFHDVKLFVGGVELKGNIDSVRIDIPEPKVTCNGKPLTPCMYLRNSDKIEVVTFDHGENYFCSYQSWTMIMEQRVQRVKYEPN